ncbi:uncharacterized protein PG986_001590 [Apiospora aurea]|uniref:DUF4604 domain-containing protein n=1 Tax=Apiospora aurea TaxID=335848 RepID=A0ABR1QXE6_9PEZI
MSDKITAKNLSYDQTLPPFLARLRGHQAPDGGPDPILAARRRTARVRTASEEAEDAPLVLDEAGNVVDMKAGELPDVDGDDGNATEGNKPAPEAKKATTTESADGEQEGENTAKETAAATIGASKKRKVGRVIGADDDEKDEREVSRAVKAAKAIAGGGGNSDKRKEEEEEEEGKTAAAAATPTTNPKPSGGGKKKAKKIKLSFGDDEAD